MFGFRKAMEQLNKGRKWVESTLFPLVGKKNWTYKGFACFPNIESRKAFKGKIDDKELKVTFQKKEKKR